MPIATAESWDGGSGGVCNDFLYSFQHVKTTSRPGGVFHNLTGGYEITSAKTTVQRAGSAFIAAEGAPSIRTVLLRALLFLKP